MALDPSAACDAQSTPFDYIVIGSGAGGGTLAAQLAESGVSVLLVEAGTDPASSPEGEGTPSFTSTREVYAVPGFHGAATEDPSMCWSFSVRHYEAAERQRLDSKYDRTRDPSANWGEGKGGILYPRSSGLGGCTGHFAMIVVKPNDFDWDAIAKQTGDESWRAQHMQGYFGKIEECLYYKSYQGFLRGLLFIYVWLMRGLRLIYPRWQLDTGGHGSKGWQKTSFIDPELILGIARGDRTFLRVLFGVFRFLWTRKGQLRALLGALGRLQVVQFFDPNFGTDRGDRSGRTAFIPIATDGRRRCSLRERLVEVASARPDKLVMLTGVLATRILFRNEGGIPRAVGVEVEKGRHLYKASPLHTEAPDIVPRQQFFARREVVVSGGAFNSPQLLMLSGIGDAEHLRELGVGGPRNAAGEQIAGVVHLPGVGRNLQDRYEVSVITQTHEPFSTLDGVTFRPGDSNDAALQKWRKADGDGGLYATNGGALAFFYKTSEATQEQPDLFIFGAPAAFRGYYWKWSQELLRAYKGAPEEQRNLWSWILLKAYTRNQGGTVRLRSSCARSQPEIIFHSFREGCADEQAAADVRALSEGVAFVRKLNASVSAFAAEIQPGKDEEVSAWVEREAWGHHACGTCRMGSDAWQEHTGGLKDQYAVLDSQFRVHGVRGLRVVDASVFPSIPGYFIVTPTFMVGEKAADVLLEDSLVYPRKLEDAEARAIGARRRKAAQAEGAPVEAGQLERLPEDTVGLALSGGGVRSATFCLGVLQALAKRGVLGRVDFLSSVSGGGYIAGFLGRLFTRMKEKVADPVKRVSDILADTGSAEIWWLRTHARYLTGAGRTDLETNVGTVWRNLLSVHVTVGFAILAAVLGVCWVGTWVDWQQPLVGKIRGLPDDLRWSRWWWTPFAVLLLGVLPAWFGFWLAPKPGSRASLSIGGLPVWILGLAGSVLLLTTSRGFDLGVAALGVLLLSWVWQEAALWRVVGATDERVRGTIARNRLTRGAGITMGLLVGAAIWVVLDTFAEYAARRAPEIPATIMGVVAASLPTLRSLAMRLTQGLNGGGKRAAGAGAARDEKSAALRRTVVLGVVAFALLGFLVFGLDVIAHWAFLRPGRGERFLLGALAVSLAIGRATGFVNLSSLQALYAARLARTYLGAANEARAQAAASSPLKDVDAAQPGDDVFLYDYHPETCGGPLHLINVCVNETVDVTSGRQLAEDKGLSMCLGPAGVSVGVRFHGLWNVLEPQHLRWWERWLGLLEQKGAPVENVRNGLTAVPLGPDPETFHVLVSRKTPTVAVENLRLSEWTGISGAALSTGLGRKTALPLALLLGLFNVRLGYWWSSHIGAGDRPGHYPPSLWRRFKGIPGTLFRTQATLLNEWRGYFAGPSRPLWYLTDGGHSENTGLYELIRRRVRFMIAVDADADPGYLFEDLGLLVRRVRLDFGANFQWIDPTAARREGATGWLALQRAAGREGIPALVEEWINPDAVGDLESMARRGAFSSALARVDYDDGGPSSWVLVLKSCLCSPPPIPLDVQCYAKGNEAFPNQSTTDQFFTDEQWESYRLLGETLMGGALSTGATVAQAAEVQRAVEAIRRWAGVGGVEVNELAGG